MPALSTPSVPSELRSAPPRDSTPLPAGFVLTEDSSTAAFDDGTVLLGGSPLRLFRISPRARDLVERWRSGAPVGDGHGGRGCWRAGSSRQAPSPRGRRTAAPGPTTSRSSCRYGTGRPSSSGCSARSTAWPASSSTTRRRTRGPPGRSPSATVSASSGWRPTSARPVPATQAWPSRTARSWPSSTPTACPRRDGSNRCSPTSTTRWWPPWRRASSTPRRQGPPTRSPATKRCAPPSTAVPTRGWCGRPARSRTCRPRPSCSVPTWPSAPTSSTRTCAAVKTSTWCGASARPAGTCATSRPAPWSTTDRRRWLRSWRARPSTGSTAGPLALPPRGHRGTAAPVRVVVGGVVAGAGSPPRPGLGGAGGVGRRPGPPARWSRPGPGRAWRCASPAAARHARPCRHWATWPAPGRLRSCSGWPCAGPAERPRSPCSSPRSRTGSTTPRRSTRCGTPPSTSPTTWRTAPGSGRGACGPARWCRWSRAWHGDPGSGRPRSLRSALGTGDRRDDRPEGQPAV